MAHMTYKPINADEGEKCILIQCPATVSHREDKELKYNFGKRQLPFLHDSCSCMFEHITAHAISSCPILHCSVGVKATSMLAIFTAPVAVYPGSRIGLCYVFLSVWGFSVTST